MSCRYTVFGMATVLFFMELLRKKSVCSAGSVKNWRKNKVLSLSIRYLVGGYTLQTAAPNRSVSCFRPLLPMPLSPGMLMNVSVSFFLPFSAP